MNRLIIKRPGSLESIITDRWLTDAQLSVIEKFISMIESSSPRELAEIEEVFNEPLPPLGGIEQYQAEGR